MEDDALPAGAGRTPLEAAAVELKPATLGDIPGVIALVARAYPDIPPYSRGQLRGQLNSFPEGQFVVTFDGAVVGFAATFVIAEALAFADHSWAEITGGGYAARHDSEGDWLYGMEVCVDPDHRGLRIGHRLYEARKRLCQDLRLKGIVFGGRMPGFRAHRADHAEPEAYLAALREGAVRDPVAGFQIRNGFEPQRILRQYMPSDAASGGHAILMAWRDPDHAPETVPADSHRRDPNVVRITTVQLEARPVTSREEFYREVRHFVDTSADYHSDFVVFPELFTLSMLAAEEHNMAPEKAIARLSNYTEELIERFREMAISHHVNIIAGSHPTRTEDGDIQNVAYVFLRDGSVHAQEKLHPTPDERYWWNIKGGDRVETIQTDCGPVGVLICYDSEFPELARRLADQGARILFVPFCTDTRQGYLRVRYCCQARAVENQCYVVTSGNVGNLPEVENMDLQYAQSAIYTPCDYPFARDGIAAETSENVEMVAVADVNLATLTWARSHGSVRNLRDRRFDLYRTVWHEPD